MFDLEKSKKRVTFLESEQARPDFWDNVERATLISKEFSCLKEEIEKIGFFRKEFNDLVEITQLSNDDLGSVLKELEILNDKIEKEEIKLFFSGKHDKKNALFQIFAGAGGQDAQDWATMLLRMYERYFVSKGFNIKVIEQSYGDSGGPDGRIGTKEVTMEVRGDWVFGTLKGERGIHRLVRISPFSSKNLRHTSFAKIDVIPEMRNNNYQINPEDLKIDTYRASGPGGQNVNKRETAVRITHIPTNIVGSSQNERQQGLNKDKAMKILTSKLARLKEEELESQIKKVKGEKVSIGWGNQIRSYVLHPYKMVKDLRTGVETSQVEKVLDGELDRLIESVIRWV
ncbi:MAG: peptide chain release factor 2 [Candidatus Pacebacteria bacterium]|nr:peptide chain release factor 2 [Candidatus Paceibacterota bacterium]